LVLCRAGAALHKAEYHLKPELLTEELERMLTADEALARERGTTFVACEKAARWQTLCEAVGLREAFAAARSVMPSATTFETGVFTRGSEGQEYLYWTSRYPGDFGSSLLSRREAAEAGSEGEGDSDSSEAMPKDEIRRKIAAGLDSFSLGKGIDGEAFFAQMDAELNEEIAEGR